MCQMLSKINLYISVYINNFNLLLYSFSIPFSNLQKHFNKQWNPPKNWKCKVKNINMCFFIFFIIALFRDLIKPTLKDKVNTDTSKPGKKMIDICNNFGGTSTGN